MKVKFWVILTLFCFPHHHLSLLDSFPPPSHLCNHISPLLCIFHIVCIFCTEPISLLPPPQKEVIFHKEKKNPLTSTFPHISFQTSKWCFKSPQTSVLPLCLFLAVSLHSFSANNLSKRSNRCKKDLGLSVEIVGPALNFSLGPQSPHLKREGLEELGFINSMLRGAGEEQVREAGGLEGIWRHCWTRGHQPHLLEAPLPAWGCQIFRLIDWLDIWFLYKIF